MEKSNEYTLEILPAALNDMTEIVSSFLMLDSKQGVIHIKDKLNKAIEQIRRFPYSGITVPMFIKQDFRMVVIEKYLMFYKVLENVNKVIFYRVLNGKRNYPSLMDKLYSKDNL